ncbi:mavicyanin-like [Apium graveolens]|uniref:mavicyanin-like n=1 Tax=Apium graveolens TaxID=4045 RepID=UPI003D78E7EC
MGAWYKVGDEVGWTNLGHVDYDAWAKSKSFRVGDTIQFVYNQGFFGVLRVTRKNYNACNATAPYSISLTGNDTFTLKYPGHYYFICGRIGHCEFGQKVHISVPANNSVPVLAPPPVLVPPPIDQSPPHHDNPSPAPVPSLTDWDKNSPGPAPEVVQPPSTSPSPSPSPHKKSGGSALVGSKVWLTSVVLLAFCACGIAF